MAFRLLFLLIILIILLIFPVSINNFEFQTFRVVLDPGHGGIRHGNITNHGDRYDTISSKYLQYYYPGAKFRSIEEHKIVYSIASKVNKLLQLTLTGKDFSSFKVILKTFTNDNPERTIIKSILSRRDSRNRAKVNLNSDPNGPYRLYDYPDKKNGERTHGRISYINSFKPHLIVSLHCDMRPPKYYRGINPVIVAPHSLLHKGLQYLKGEIKSRYFFYNSPYSYWFVESVKRRQFNWFLNDVSVYFTGFPINRHEKIRKNRFAGFRHNMTDWKYKDPAGWELLAQNHPGKTRYSSSHDDYYMQGRFWKRERSKYEKYRRDGGDEGFGGDNYYACTEIIKYILCSLDLNNLRHRSQKLGNPYISVWSVPLLVNAISAYIELGYIYRRRDRYLLTKKQDQIAEGIAVGIYSLLAGLKPKNIKSKYLPKGKRVDLKKYKITSDKDYFDDVIY